MYRILLLVFLQVTSILCENIFAAFASHEEGPVQFDSPLVGVKRSEGFFLERTLPEDTRLVAFAPMKKSERRRLKLSRMRNVKLANSEGNGLNLVLPPPIERTSIKRASRLKQNRPQSSEYCVTNSALYKKFCFNMSVDRPPALRSRLYEFCPYYENTCMKML